MKLDQLPFSEILERFLSARELVGKLTREGIDPRSIALSTVQGQYGALKRELDRRMPGTWEVE